MIKGIHHVAIKCTNMEEYKEELAFYINILQLPVKREWATGTMLDTGNGLMEIFNNGDSHLGLGVIRHFAFATDNVDEIVERARKNGHEVIIEPKDIVIASNPELPARIAFLRGPMGEEIELFCER